MLYLGIDQHKRQLTVNSQAEDGVVIVKPDNIRDWHDFCQGKKDFNLYHFSSLFRELNFDRLSTNDLGNLRAVFECIPNSQRAFQMMLRMEGRAEDKTDDQILVLVKQDLHQKRQVVKLDDKPDIVLGVIDADAYHFTTDEARFEEARNSSVNGQLFHSIAGYMMRKVAQCHKCIAALSNAFYELASDLQLKWSLTAALIELEVDFGNYFELYLIGVDYALATDQVVIMNYRAAMNSAKGTAGPGVE